MNGNTLFSERSNYFLERSHFQVLCQRIKVPTFLNSFTTNKSDPTSRNLSFIELTHKDAITEGMIKNINNLRIEDVDIECKGEPVLKRGDDIQLKVSNKISNNEFREKCIDAKKKCKYYANLFRHLESFSLGITCMIPIYAIFINYFKLDIIYVVMISGFLIVLLFFNSFGEWARLREKYARLAHEFIILSNSKDEDRIQKYLAYAENFSDGELFVDSLE